MKDIEIYGGKNFSDLLKEIHQSTNLKSVTIHALIQDLRKFMLSGEEMVVIAPIIKDYLEVLTKNDEHLVKIAAIIQRVIAVESKATGGAAELLSDEDKAALYASAMEELEHEVMAVERENVIPITRTK